MNCLFIFLAALSSYEEPEPPTGCNTKSEVFAKKMMVVTSNRFATQAGFDMLKKGGNALDAAIAAQAVMNLVEPQSSGIGGGGFLLFYNAKDKSTTAYDGREIAPLDFVIGNEKEKTVGVPGLLSMLDLAHREVGKLPWNQLFESAIHLAENGFPISPRLHLLIRTTRSLSSKDTPYLFLNDKPKEEGALLANVELANTFRLIAEEGIAPFYAGPIAEKIVEATHHWITLEDLARYQPLKRTPIFYKYKNYKVVTVSPPAGGLTVLQILGLFEHIGVATNKRNFLNFALNFAKASRLAYADRNYYLADPDFIPVPVTAMLNKHYLKYRAESKVNNKDEILPGFWPAASQGFFPFDSSCPEESLSTAQLCVRDSEGNMVSFTTSIGNAFGSKVFVEGFFLNDHLTDFSDKSNVANSREAGKRPLSAMSPLFVWDENNQPYLMLGSAGGARICDYISQALIDTLDFNYTLQEAISHPHIVSMNTTLELERNSSIESYKSTLQKEGYKVIFMPHTSGMQGIQFTKDGMFGAVDPRREGVALGE